MSVRAPLVTPTTYIASLKERIVGFAMRCDIGASLRTLLRNLGATSSKSKLATRPEEHILPLIEWPAKTGIIAPHCFSFGAALETAGWIKRVSAGEFVMDDPIGQMGCED